MWCTLIHGGTPLLKIRQQTEPTESVRPVNVIRLVLKDSLEEKILELHARKREIAADFLEGTSGVAAEAMKLSEEELLDLLN